MSEYKKLCCDVAVVGGGLTGTIAAAELARAGKRVVILRDGRGASPHVAGFNVAGAEQGDGIEPFIQDTNESARGLADPALVSILCEGSTQLVDYLGSIGFSFDTDERGRLKARKSLGSTYARVVGKGNSSGAEILSILDRELRERQNVTLLEQTRALRLFAEDGCIQGLLAYDRHADGMLVLEAPTVLLASGGYAGIFPFTSNSKDISGDTVAMALYAGAHLTDMEFVQFEPSCAVWPESIRGKGMITTLFYEGATLTNAEGERFMFKTSPDGERVNKDVLARAIARELREGKPTVHGGVYFDASGVDAARLHEAYEPFVRRCQAVGIDLCTEPVEVANAAHTSLGGVKVDASCRSCIEGLFAAGEALGNLHGANRIGGSAGTETLVFSRHAARAILSGKPNAVRPITDGAIARLCERSDAPAITPERLGQIRTEATELIGRYLGVERDGVGLSLAAERLDALRTELIGSSFGKKASELFAALSLENTLTTALALARSALTRNDSAGCHLRTDFPDAAPERYRTDVTLTEQGVTVSKIKL